MLTSSSSNSWIVSIKLLLIFAGVVSVAVTAKLAVPAMLNIAENNLPAIWSVVVSWLKPPYLYVIINAIIITIVASTRFQTTYRPENQSQQQVSYNPSIVTPPTDLTSELPPVPIHLNSGLLVEPPVAYERKRDDTDVETLAMESTWNPSQSSVVDSPPPPRKVQPEFNFPVREKRFVNSRFAFNKKPTKNILEGARALGVLKPKKHETLDTTWKMITDGHRMSSTRQFRKSDTFENLRYDSQSDESIPPAMTKVVRKSDTFKDRMSYENQNHYPDQRATNLSPALILKKDVSLSPDELNRRVEAFIKKFNDDMRLERQKSLDQYMETVDRRAR